MLKQQFKEMLVKIAMMSFGVILALILLEFGISLYEKTKPAVWTNFTFHEELGWIIKPNLDLSDTEFGYHGTLVDLQTNSDGLRTIPREFVDEDAFVIAVQGDSQTAGFGMDNADTAVSRLAECLEQNFEQIIQVVNFGTNGYDLNQYLTQAKLLVANYNVDMLVMMLHHSNDFGLATIEYPYGTYRPYWRLIENNLVFVKPPVPFRQQIYPYQFQEDFSQFNHTINSLNRDYISYDPYHPLSWSATYLEFRRRTWRNKSSENFESNSIEIFDPIGGDWAYIEPLSEPYNTYLPTFQAIIHEWSRTVDNSFVYLLTTQYNVLPEYTSERIARFNELNYPEPILSLNNNLSKILKQLNIEYYDSWSEFMNFQITSELYLSDDDHLSALGQSFVGDSLCRELTKRLKTMNFN